VEDADHLVAGAQQLRGYRPLQRLLHHSRPAGRQLVNGDYNFGLHCCSSPPPGASRQVCFITVINQS
jgi:hypothetical protein